MAKPVARIVALEVALGAALLLIIGRAGYLQLVKGREFALRAAKLHTVSRELEPRRGTIYDRNGTPLAISQPRYHVQIALGEVKDTERVVGRLAGDLGLPDDSIRRTFLRGTPKYLWLPGPWTASQVASLRSLQGVHLETVYSRAYPSTRLAAPIVGALVPESGRGLSGVELSLDSLLAGQPGLTTDLRDASGSRYQSPGRLVREPVAGYDVVLTLDAELQGIAEQSLAAALRGFRARGGDVVFLDPRSGELLALASLSEAGGEATPSVFTSAFEPGSTAKPFTAAALLALGRVGRTETVTGEHGTWTYETSRGHTRTISDTHAHEEPLTLARAIQYSSNIAMAKFSRKLRWEEQYDLLRAFGFGAPTGVEFPSEASGRLLRPHTWQPGYEAQSMAMGYAIQVTPVQLAAAYGALANDGLLLAPTLVREIRKPDGEVLYRHEPEPVRRVVSREVAAAIRGFLALAANDSGTGGRAQLRYGLIGKTGTALERGSRGYGAAGYRASFAAIFPARDPQLVVIVTIDRPRGEHYGGLTAAPMTADMLRQALAARRSTIDLSAIADQSVEASRPVPFAPRDDEDGRGPSVAVRLPLPARASRPPPVLLVPDVSGRTVRQAAFALHQRGFRVRVEGSGRVVRSHPAARDSATAGRTVTLYAGSEAKRP
jgi:cell division protein FtsI (penicillin-binding protein 3)